MSRDTDDYHYSGVEKEAEDHSGSSKHPHRCLVDFFEKLPQQLDILLDTVRIVFLDILRGEPFELFPEILFPVFQKGGHGGGGEDGPGKDVEKFIEHVDSAVMISPRSLRFTTCIEHMPYLLVHLVVEAVVVLRHSCVENRFQVFEELTLNTGAPGVCCRSAVVMKQGAVDILTRYEEFHHSVSYALVE